MKPMNVGQRALYEIAVDTNRTRKFLRQIAILQMQLRLRDALWAGICLACFFLGSLIGAR